MGKEMTNEQKRQYNRNYYQSHRAEKLSYQRAYNRDYRSKGLRKPRQRKPRGIRDHERYMEKHDEIREYQRTYYEANREKINARRRKRYREKIIENLRVVYQ